MSKSNYLEDKILDHALGTTAFTQPTNQYLALHTADPTDAASGAELSDASVANRTGYARATIDFNAASGGTATGPDGSNTIEFTNSHGSSSWTEVTHFGIYDGLTDVPATVNGAVSSSTSVTVDGKTGTIAVGMKATATGISGDVFVASISSQASTTATVVLDTAVSISDDVSITFSTNLLSHGALTTPKTIAAGDTLRFTAGSISISEA